MPSQVTLVEFPVVKPTPVASPADVWEVEAARFQTAYVSRPPTRAALEEEDLIVDEWNR
jgi:hypothetical protein